MDDVAYIRVSTPQQGKSGLGLAAQKEIVQRFLGNTQPIAEFIEVESGKRDKKRPQLRAAIELCKKKKARLIIAKLDRLARNVAFIATLIESGVNFVCCDNPHANKAMLQMLAVFAEYEHEMISQRNRDMFAAIKKELVEKGYRISHSGRMYTALGSSTLSEARAKAAAYKNANRPSPHTLALMAQLRVAGYRRW